MTRSVTFSPRQLFIFAVATVCVAAFSLCGTAYAGDSLLWYDGFVIDDDNPGDPTTYQSTVNLHGQNGGTGTFFTGDWFQANFNPVIGNTQSEVEDPMNPGEFLSHEDTWVVPNSLSRPNQSLPSTGGKSSDFAIGFGGDLCCHTSRTSREFATPFSGLDETIYMGFLMNYGNGNPTDPHYRSVEFWNVGNSAVGPGDDFLNMSIGFSSFGNYGFDENGVIQFFSLGIDGARTDFLDPDFDPDAHTNHILPQRVAYGNQVGQTQSVVLKFELSTDDVEIGGTGDTVSVFLNPELDETSEPTPDLVVSNLDLSLDRMSSNILFHFTGPQPENPGEFDELRVGQTWESVAILSDDLDAPGAISPGQISVGSGDTVMRTINGGDSVSHFDALTWELHIDGGPADPAIAPTLGQDGSFSWDTSGSPNGVYEFSVWITDEAGNMGSAAFSVQVPEPASVVLMGLAMLGLGLIRRR